MTDKRPASTTELLSSIEREWNALMAAARKLTPQQMTKADAGGWSPKDNLAHLAAWMRALVEYHIDGGRIEEVLDLPRGRKQPWDDDSINAVLFERNRGRSSEDVLKELERVYADVKTKLKALPYEELLKPDRGNRTSGKDLIDYVLGNTTEHFAEHRATIEKML